MNVSSLLDYQQKYKRLAAPEVAEASSGDAKAPGKSQASKLKFKTPKELEQQYGVPESKQRIIEALYSTMLHHSAEEADPAGQKPGTPRAYRVKSPKQFKNPSSAAVERAQQLITRN